MEYGDTCILQNIVNTYTFEIKFTILKKGDKSKIAKGAAPHEGIRGNPFGTKFELTRESKTLRVVTEGGGLHADIMEELDNRGLVDQNQITKGRENSQKLGVDEISALRKSGVDGKGVMKSLIENSATFKQKTPQSQEKWLKRKAVKHAPTFTALRCTSLSMCRAYFLKEPSRTCNMREDSLARMLTLSNVQPGSRVLMADSMNGLLVGAVAERLGGMGLIMNGFNGVQPSVDAIRWMDFSAEDLKKIVHFPLCELSYTDDADLDALDAAVPQRAARKESGEGAEGKEGKEDGAGGHMEVDGGDAAEQSEQGQEGGAAAAAETPEQAEEKQKLRTIANRLKRLESGHKTSMSFRRNPIVSEMASLRDVQAELRRGFDSLVVGGTLLPALVVPRLVKQLKPSSPFVVFSPYNQPLLDCMEVLMKDECTVDMNITETWMREYQVLPGRTHPNMHMSCASGFILFGYKVEKQIRKPDAPPPKPTKAKPAEGAAEAADAPPNKKAKTAEGAAEGGKAEEGVAEATGES